ncbi:phosphotransferase family protein [Streptomyces beijiangensis]|uniref:Phosphotransferase n=1 Tax=Streptomyces beijiangensis TaxID=163361 RepID=A0A939FFL4_9ACTN|nr:aminoglycoside phosphotransferase family protein [Streptomyces beijiangensis]MBO0517058.1 phosphotransferase [Streptomyces beijiangensis]
MSAETVSLARRLAVELNLDELIPLKGYHHDTWVFSLPDTGEAGEAGVHGRWKCREPRPGLFWFDRRCFTSEEDLLRVLAGRVRKIPELLEFDGVGLQRFIEGRTLGEVTKEKAALPESYIGQLMELFSEMVHIRPEDLKIERSCGSDEESHELADGDTSGFLRRLVDFTENEVFLRHRDRFGKLLGRLGVDDEALMRFRKRMSTLTERPFCLLHGDLHRENFIVDGEDRLWTIDWELAMFGDPLYDLATHLYLMRYPPEQAQKVILQWCDTVEWVRKGSSDGWKEDLPQLLAYKRAQSVYTDVIRSALTVGADRDLNWPLLLHTVLKLRRVLVRAQDVLELGSLPGLWQVVSALLAWRRSDRASTVQK